MIKGQTQIVFEDLFNNSDDPYKNKIIYKGKTLIRLDWFEMQEETEDFVLVFESKNSKNYQGVALDSDDGYVQTESLKHSGVRLWETKAPDKIYFTVINKKKKFAVFNVWDNGNGVVHYWHNGAAMWVEDIPGGKRYHCNDGQPNDDLNDIVFTIKRVEK